MAFFLQSVVYVFKSLMSGIHNNGIQTVMIQIIIFFLSLEFCPTNFLLCKLGIMINNDVRPVILWQGWNMTDNNV